MMDNSQYILWVRPGNVSSSTTTSGRGLLVMSFNYFILFLFESRFKSRGSVLLFYSITQYEGLKFIYIGSGFGLRISRHASVIFVSVCMVYFCTCL